MCKHSDLVGMRGERTGILVRVGGDGTLEVGGRGNERSLPPRSTGVLPGAEVHVLRDEDDVDLILTELVRVDSRDGGSVLDFEGIVVQEGAVGPLLIVGGETTVVGDQLLDTAVNGEVDAETRVGVVVASSPTGAGEGFGLEESAEVS